MKYRPRKLKKATGSRTKPHYITVHGVLEEIPDYRALVRSSLRLTPEEIDKLLAGKSARDDD